MAKAVNPESIVKELEQLPAIADMPAYKAESAKRAALQVKLRETDTAIDELVAFQRTKHTDAHRASIVDDIIASGDVPPTYGMHLADSAADRITELRRQAGLLREAIEVQEKRMAKLEYTLSAEQITKVKPSYETLVSHMAELMREAAAVCDAEREFQGVLFRKGIRLGAAMVSASFYPDRMTLKPGECSDVQMWLAEVKRNYPHCL